VGRNPAVPLGQLLAADDPRLPVPPLQRAPRTGVSGWFARRAWRLRCERERSSHRRCGHGVVERLADDGRRPSRCSNRSASPTRRGWSAPIGCPTRCSPTPRQARERGLRAIIAGAGGAAHLPGMLAAKTTVPVLGVPVPSRHLSGQDSLYSIVQMPAGVPVATFAIGEAGATNAALFAVALLADDDAGAARRARRLPPSAGVNRRVRRSAAARSRRDPDRSTRQRSACSAAASSAATP
jgi:phosphoribosylaminoimidazole carboxylase PurE protein